jgi:competence ComEA-like helix-hairpin-helix protein
VIRRPQDCGELAEARLNAVDNTMPGPASETPQCAEGIVPHPETAVLSFRLRPDQSTAPTGVVLEAAPASHVPAAQSVAAPAANAPDTHDGPALGLSSSDRRFLLVVGGTIFVLAGLHWALLSGWGMQPVEVSRLPARQYDYRIDVNRATWVEWMQLDGIGEITARAIVSDRDANGPFRSIEDVTRVKGIGPKTLEAMRPWLACGDCDPATSAD